MAVLRVARDGVACVLGVHSDLVHPPRERPRRHERRPRGARQHLEVRQGVLRPPARLRLRRLHRLVASSHL